MYNPTRSHDTATCHPLTRSLRHSLIGLGALALVPLAACELPADEAAVSDEAGTPDGQTLRDGEIRVAAATLADIDLKVGPRLVFIDAAAPDQEPRIGVYEFVPAGHVGTSDFAELASASPLELFLAATTDDTEIPARLLAADRAAGSLFPAIDRIDRGWLRDAVRQRDRAKSHCNDGAFKAAVNAKGYNDLGTPKFRLNQTAGSSAYFVEHYYQYPVEGTGTFANQYYVGGGPGSRWYNIDRYYTRVAVCKLGSHPTLYGSNGIVVHPGPTVSVRYRDSNNQPVFWKSVLNHDYSGLGTSAWHFYTGTNWDWKTLIDLAADADMFDIGHAVENL